MYIMPLLPYWSIARTAGTPIYSSFYTEYYTQEDRMKALAIKIGRMEAWNHLLLEKVNELVERVNELEGNENPEAV